MSSTFPYRLHTGSLPLTTSWYQPVSPCWPFPRRVSPGPHRVATGPLPPGTPPYRSLNVRSALLTSHTVYKSWALTRPVTLQFSIFFYVLLIVLLKILHNSYNSEFFIMPKRQNNKNNNNGDGMETLRTRWKNVTKIKKLRPERFVTVSEQAQCKTQSNRTAWRRYEEGGTVTGRY